MINNRWFQLCASLVAMIMIANLQYGWTLFVQPMRAETHWPLTGVQDAFAWFILFQTWVQPLDGWLIDRLGQRWFISAAGILCGVGWAGMGMATSIQSLTLLYIVAGIGAAFTYSGSIGSALKWFRERRGLAAGIMAAGFGGGTALFTPIISRLIGEHGYRTAFIYTGVFQGVMILVAAQFLRQPPPAPVSTSSAKSSPVERVGTHQFTTLEMLRTPQFYALYAAFVMMAAGGLFVTASQGPLADAWGFKGEMWGFKSVLTLAAFCSPLANGASRISWGFISDRIGREQAMITAFILQALSLIAVATLGPSSSTMFVVTLVLVYFTWGEVFSLFPSTSGDYFGAKHATSNYAVLYTAKGIAAIFGVSIANRIHDRTGSWTITFYLGAVLAVMSAVIITGLLARKRARARQVAVVA